MQTMNQNIKGLVLLYQLLSYDQLFLRPCSAGGPCTKDGAKIKIFTKDLFIAKFILPVFSLRYLGLAWPLIFAIVNIWTRGERALREGIIDLRKTQPLMSSK